MFLAVSTVRWTFNSFSTAFAASAGGHTHRYFIVVFLCPILHMLMHRICVLARRLGNVNWPHKRARPWILSSSQPCRIFDECLTRILIELRNAVFKLQFIDQYFLHILKMNRLYFFKTLIKSLLCLTGNERKSKPKAYYIVPSNGLSPMICSY